MRFPVLLAHGALGVFDEVILIAVAVAFLVMMGVTWLKSRHRPPDVEFPDATATDLSQPDAPEPPERFRLD